MQLSDAAFFGSGFRWPQFVHVIQRVVLSSSMLCLCKVIIFAVSAFDIYLTIKFVDSLPSLELNPIGRWMMDLDSTMNCPLEQIAIFVTSKFAGNFVVLVVIDYLADWRRTWAGMVAIGVALCQLMLLYFLAFAEHGSIGA